MQTRSRFGRVLASPDALALILIVAVWVRWVGSYTALSLTAEKLFVPVGSESPSSWWSTLISQGMYLAIIALCVVILITRINDITKPGLLRIGVLIVPWLWILIRLAVDGQFTPDAALYPLLLLTLAALRPHPRVLASIGVLVALAAVIAIAFGLFLPEAGRLREADGSFRVSEKENLPALGLLQGMFTSENSLGLYLVLGLPLIFLIRRAWLKWLALAVTLFAVYWTSSRGSLFTVQVALVVGAVVWMLRRFWRPEVVSAITRVGLGVLLAGMVALPFLGWSDDAFTKRGVIWNYSIAEVFARGPAFGMGIDWYAELSRNLTTPLHGGAYSGHNLAVHLLATAGITGLVLVIGSLAVQAWSVTGPRQPYPAVAAMVVAVLFASGYMEVPLGYVDRSLFWLGAIIPLAVMYLHTPVRRRLPQRVTV